jgi:hypothetical protein
MYACEPLPSLRSCRLARVADVVMPASGSLGEFAVMPGELLALADFTLELAQQVAFGLCHECVLSQSVGVNQPLKIVPHSDIARIEKAAVYLGFSMV